MYKLTEAKHFAGSFVYGLYDRDGLFYIGKTTNAKRRFSRYLDRMMNYQVKQRLSKGGDDK